MKSIFLEEKYILEYIRDTLSDLKTKTVEPKNIGYHHNCTYSDAPLILEYGILPIRQLVTLGLKKYTEKQLIILNDINSHANGVDKIKSVDIRLLEYLESNTSFVESIINKYNSLKDIAIALKQLDLDIPLREMSSQNITMDVDKLLETPKILIKK